ncbi:hypothetical protein JS531_07535 [Bifidobacterium sp. CP2]|uniref:DUF6049 family protein n=1 Tax=Bifidobacterium sp. CP2 TaxID=2809025 RepID=UPI001BDCF9CD|nr:DUF6049 family protein [Bifidobacterium sp. CP2]MBT1181806.1 hypothetical protein [Bifidobacterium sp. CP2]
MSGLLLAVAFLAGAVALPAFADDASGTSGTSDTASTSDASGTDGTQDADARQVIALNGTTSPVTATSGYHLMATVTNTSQDTWSAGTFTLSLNPKYSFTSRTDIQEWAQSAAAIPTRAVLGEVDVPELAPGDSTVVNVDASADADALEAITVWGPKPLLVSYAHDGAVEELHTFLTRSAEGLANAATPAMQITMAMPLTSGHWTVDTQSLESLVTNGTTSTATTSSDGSGTSGASTSDGTNGTVRRDLSAAVLDGDHTRFDTTLSQTLSKHTALQTVADPTYLSALAIPPKVTAISQPAGFDITAYAAMDDADGYANAGIATDSWSADTATAWYRAALGDQKAKSTAIAWQGKAKWTLKALTEARRQGYSTVVSTYDFESTGTDTVHTGTTIVPTDAGDVTVLVEQRELGNLAKGEATSRKALAESTEAGRLARFVAQSAFYQMEQPYTARNLLVCFSADAAASTIDAFMGAVESSPWLELTDLDTLASTSPYTTGEEAKASVPDASGLSDADAASIHDALSALVSARNDIVRFRDAILAKDDDSSSGSGSGSSNAQALARQDAKATARLTGSARWAADLLAAHDQLALHAMAADGGSSALGADATSVLQGARQLSSDVMSGVTLTPSEAVTMLSETASMPVTVSNVTPYPVTIQVSSITDSPEIVTSRRVTVTVPARSEAQVTFSLRAATSGSTSASVSLEDREGRSFGAVQHTDVTCVLKISDKTGFVIIGFAVLLGALGLWRQFNRKKDPDE